MGFPAMARGIGNASESRVEGRRRLESKGRTAVAWGSLLEFAMSSVFRKSRMEPDLNPTGSERGNGDAMTAGCYLSLDVAIETLSRVAQDSSGAKSKSNLAILVVWIINGRPFGQLWSKGIYILLNSCLGGVDSVPCDHKLSSYNLDKVVMVDALKLVSVLVRARL